MSDLIRIAKLEKNSSTDIMFSITDYQDQKYVDVREHVDTDSYTGFTKKGIRFKADLVDGWIENLQKVKDVLDGKAEPPEQEEEGDE